MHGQLPSIGMNHTKKLPPRYKSIRVDSNRRIHALCVVFLLHPAEVGAHLIRQTGESIQQFGVVPEHFIILRLLVHNIVVNLAPAFLERGICNSISYVLNYSCPFG